MKTVGNLLITFTLTFFAVVPVEVKEPILINDSEYDIKKPFLEQRIVNKIDSIENYKCRIREIQEELK